MLSFNLDFPGGSSSKTSAYNSCWEDPLEKEMATQASILAWRIPQMEEPGRLQSVGSQRVGHDLMTLLSKSFMYVKIKGTSKYWDFLGNPAIKT